MPRSTHRSLALLVFGTLAVALTAVMVIPGLGYAQDATPAGGNESSESQLMSRGEELYNQTCIACHMAGGAGAESEVSFTHYPPLADNPFVTTDDPTAVTLVLLTGRAGMPSFSGMSDEDLASILTYVRGSWENDASAVEPDMVTEVRESIPVVERDPATPFPSPSLEAEATPES